MRVPSDPNASLWDCAFRAAGSLVLAPGHRDHPVDPGLQRPRRISGAKERRDLLVEDLVRAEVRQGSLEAVSHLDAHLPILHEDEEDRPVVQLRPAHAPGLRRPYREVLEGR